MSSIISQTICKSFSFCCQGGLVNLISVLFIMSHTCSKARFGDRAGHGQIISLDTSNLYIEILATLCLLLFRAAKDMEEYGIASSHQRNTERSFCVGQILSDKQMKHLHDITLGIRTLLSTTYGISRNSPRLLLSRMRRKEDMEWIVEQVNNARCKIVEQVVDIYLEYDFPNSL